MTDIFVAVAISKLAFVPIPWPLPYLTESFDPLTSQGQLTTNPNQALAIASPYLCAMKALCKSWLKAFVQSTMSIDFMSGLMTFKRFSKPFEWSLEYTTSPKCSSIQDFTSTIIGLRRVCVQ